MKKKSKKKPRKEVSKMWDVKKTLAFKLLVICVILLFTLVVVWIVVYEPSEIKEKGFGLPTLGFGDEVSENIIDVLSYQTNEDNTSIELVLNWSAGTDPLNDIKLIFHRDLPEGDCEYIFGGSNLNFGVATEYPAIGYNLQGSTCGLGNFTNLTGVNASAGINVIISRVLNDWGYEKELNLDTLYEGENHTNINLSEYFECNLGYDELEFNVSSESENITVIYDEINKNVSFYPDYGWFGQQSILINASCRFEEFLDYAVIDVNPNLTQITSFGDINLFYDENLTVGDLDDYYICDNEISEYKVFKSEIAFTEGNNVYWDHIYLTDQKYIINGSDSIEFYLNESTNVLKVYSNSSIPNYTSFSIRAFCTPQYDYSDGFYINYSNYVRPPQNHAPDFDSNGIDNDYDCDDLLWNRNSSYTRNLSKCWDDEDGDSLVFRYKNSSNNNVSIVLSNSILTLTPDTNWVGTGYFYVYANDSELEEGERIDITVRIPPTAAVINDTNVIAPKIKTSSPSATSVIPFNGSKTFSITAENYTTIKWYLNGRLLNGSELSFNFSDLKDKDVVKVEIIRGTRKDSKIWDIKVDTITPAAIPDVEGEIEVPKEIDIGWGNVIFYLIIGILGIIILLIIWIFIAEKGKKKRKIDVGFGISGGGQVGKQTPSRIFNIPKR